MSSRSVPSATEVPSHYYVDGFCGWFVIRCSTKRIARSCGVQEFGRGGVLTVRPATTMELAQYNRQRFGYQITSSADAPPLPLEDSPHG